MADVLTEWLSVELSRLPDNCVGEFAMYVAAAGIKLLFSMKGTSLCDDISIRVCG